MCRSLKLQKVQRVRNERYYINKRATNILNVQLSINSCQWRPSMMVAIGDRLWIVDTIVATTMVTVAVRPLKSPCESDDAIFATVTITASVTKFTVASMIQQRHLCHSNLMLSLSPLSSLLPLLLCCHCLVYWITSDVTSKLIRFLRP